MRTEAVHTHLYSCMLWESRGFSDFDLMQGAGDRMERMLLKNNVDDGDSGIHDAVYLRLYTMPHSKCFALIIPFMLTMIQLGGIIICISIPPVKAWIQTG